MKLKLTRYQHPLLFYLLATAIPWSFWFFAAWISHTHTETELLTTSIGLLGLISPCIIAFVLIKKDNVLWIDFKYRIFNIHSIPLKYGLLCLCIMFGSIILAQLISIPLGYGTAQFIPSGKTSFSAGLLPGSIMLFLAPLLEELAWHSYGTDCLRARMNLLKASLLFALFWSLWHLPLSFIKDYYHSHVAAAGFLHSLNFIISIFPFVILMNWIYYKTSRNILIAIIFHISAGCSNEFFSTHPDSKIIQTLLLSILSTYLVFHEKSFWTDRKISH